MCKAVNYAEQLAVIFNNIANDSRDLYNQLDETNSIQQDLLHKIENENFNACEGYNFAKMIKDNRVKRRQVKNELKPLNTLKNEFIDKYISELQSVISTVKSEDTLLTELTTNKIYKPRVLKIKNETSNPKVTITNERVRFFYKKTGGEIEIINKVSDDMYYVKLKSGHKCLLKAKHIRHIEKFKCESN